MLCALLLPVLLIVTVWLWLPELPVLLVAVFSQTEVADFEPAQPWVFLQVYVWVCAPVVFVLALWLCAGNSPTVVYAERFHI